MGGEERKSLKLKHEQEEMHRKREKNLAPGMLIQAGKFLNLEKKQGLSNF